MLTMKNNLQVGFYRVQNNPSLGTNIRGYFHQRLTEGFIDDLEINAIAIKSADTTVALVCIDALGSQTEFCDKARAMVAEATGIDKDAVFIHSTHTHVAPNMGQEDELTNDLDRLFYQTSLYKIVDCVSQAIADLKPAKMGIAFSKAERIGFNRRYLMKDGTTKTNPGVNNPDIVKSIGLLDETLNVVRFDRGDDSIVIGNYGNHPDVIGGNKLSADWPGLARRVFEKAVDNTKCVVFNGAQGDINHVNVKPVKGDLNGMFVDFDDVTRGYAHSKHMANVVAGAMMSVYEKVEYLDVDEVKFVQKDVMVASNMPKPEDMERARYIKKMVDEGRRDELPEKGMMLTTVIAEAKRMIRWENGPEYIPLHFSAIKIGDIAFIGIPGEPFTGIGIGLKKAKGYKMVLPCCIVNAYSGYFPMQDSYDEGGYEARSSNFKAGVAETIIKEGVKIIENL